MCALFKCDWDLLSDRNKFVQLPPTNDNDDETRLVVFVHGSLIAGSPACLIDF